MKEKKRIKKVWEEYYQNNPDTALKDKVFFGMELNAINNKIKIFIKNNPVSKKIQILEIGCGTGLLAKFILAKNKQRQNIRYTGVDFSSKAIKIASARKIKNSAFINDDFTRFLQNKKGRYDIILSQRSVMALINPRQQRRLLRLINQAKKKSGVGIFSEITKDAYDQINKLRNELNLENIKKVWHSRHLRLIELKKIFKQIQIIDYSSPYWLITRVIYPYFTKQPTHNSQIAKFASSLEQTGNYSLVRLIIVK